MKKISGGVCAAQGFTASGIHVGVKHGSDPHKNDLALIVSETECAAAATFTNNRVKEMCIRDRKYPYSENLERV